MLGAVLAWVGECIGTIPHKTYQMFLVEDMVTALVGSQSGIAFHYQVMSVAFDILSAALECMTPGLQMAVADP